MAQMYLHASDLLICSSRIPLSIRHPDPCCLFTPFEPSVDTEQLTIAMALRIEHLLAAMLDYICICYII